MQKKLIAVAVAALASGAAFAADNVTLYGKIDAAVAHVSASGQKSDTLVVSGGLSASRIGVKGVEDLGNGLKVVGVLEYALDVADSTGIGAARQEMLALAGSFGTVAAGYLQTTGYDFSLKFDPTAGSAVSPLDALVRGNGLLIGDTGVAARAQRAMAYISPDFSGFNFAINYSTALAGLGNLTVASNAADVSTTAWLVSGNYANGPMAASLVYAKADAPTVGASQTDWALGGSYDFGVAKLMATYQKGHTDAVGVSGNSRKAWSLSGVIPAGAGAVALTYAKLTDDRAVSSDAKGYAAVYLHPLSKRTTAYAAYQHMSQDAGIRSYSVYQNNVATATLDLGGSSSLLAAGLNHVF